MRDSIFYASLRTFFVALFGVAGVLIGLALVATLIGLIAGSADLPPQITTTYTAEIAPNAKGVRKALSSDAPVILKLNIDGIIGLDSLTKDAIRKQLTESREGTFANDRVKAILLHINTPGGTVDDADGIYRALKEYKASHKVPVYAFVDGLCASGGMYVASAADKVFATDISLIGSVGVLIPPQFNLTQLMEKVGVQSLTISDGLNKDSLNPFRPWKKGEEDNIKEAVQYFYKEFVGLVTSARPQLDRTKLIDEYGANVYPAPLAKEYGYIDVSGASYDVALKALAEKISIEDDYYQVVELTHTTWLSELVKTRNNLLQGNITHTFDFGAEFSPGLRNKFLYLYCP